MILAIAGSIGSGKTTLARALTAALGAKHAAFGDFVRAQATDQGLDPTDRQVLQDLGHERVEQNAAAFLSDTLVWAGHQPEELLVLDGLRHMTILAALRDRAAKGFDQVTLVYLNTPPDLRYARVTARGVSLPAITADETHPAELDLSQRLREAADLVLSGDRTTEELTDQVLAYLEGRQRPFSPAPSVIERNENES